MPTSTEPLPKATVTTENISRKTTFDAFRRWGYLQASLDPLGQYLAPQPFPTPPPDGPDADEARRYYCGTIGAEFMHIPSIEKRAWIQERLEREYTAPDTARVLTGRPGKTGPAPEHT